VIIVVLAGDSLPVDFGVDGNNYFRLQTFRYTARNVNHVVRIRNTACRRPASFFSRVENNNVSKIYIDDTSVHTHNEYHLFFRPCETKNADTFRFEKPYGQFDITLVVQHVHGDASFFHIILHVPTSANHFCSTAIAVVIYLTSQISK